MTGEPPLDTKTSVVTPENIAFDYPMAGPFQRLPAYLVDQVAQWLILGAAAVIALLTGLTLQIASLGVLAVFGFMVGWFLLTFFYGAVMETVFNGRTIGKWFAGIRVVRQDGSPLDGRSAVLRNLLRVADSMPLAPLPYWMFDETSMPPVYFIPTGVVALAVMTSNRRMQRLGDIAAGTMVVIDSRESRLPLTNIDDARVPALASFIPADFRVSAAMARCLASYIQRRPQLSAARRREIARHLTDPLIDRFGFRPDIDPDLMVYSLYFRTFLDEGRGSDVDLGPLAGFSPMRSETPIEDETAPVAQPDVRDVSSPVASADLSSISSSATAVT